jgi:hypothetical protein
MGAWLSYGLGSTNRDLPTFISLVSGTGHPDGGNACWGNGFLPGIYQGVELDIGHPEALFLESPPGVSPSSRRRQLDALRDLNTLRHDAIGAPEIETRIANYELGFRMQESVPELLDIADEPDSVHALYGTTPGESSFANNCLLARRMVERGVRFVQLNHMNWDHHGVAPGTDLEVGLRRECRNTDRACAGLIRDLERTGLLDETLVIWAGEFGRTPMNEEREGSKLLGRDHHPRAFTIWMAGGGIKPGITIGRTDDIGYEVVEDPVSVHDVHATILQLMGLDHTRLTYLHRGRNFRLTDVYGDVIQQVLA